MFDRFSKENKHVTSLGTERISPSWKVKTLESNPSSKDSTVACKDLLEIAAPSMTIQSLIDLLCFSVSLP